MRVMITDLEVEERSLTTLLISGNGNGEGGEDRDRNRNEAMLILAESATELESLPKDLAAAIEAGRIPGSVITKFLELQRSAVMRWLMQFAGLEKGYWPMISS